MNAVEQNQVYAKYELPATDLIQFPEAKQNHGELNRARLNMPYQGNVVKKTSYIWANEVAKPLSSFIPMTTHLPSEHCKGPQVQDLTHLISESEYDLRLNPPRRDLLVSHQQLVFQT